MLYLIQIDHRVFERKGGGGFGLVEALREVYGTANAKVLRLDGTVVVERAGSAGAMIYKGRPGEARLISRRLSRVGRRRYEAQMRRAA